MTEGLQELHVVVRGGGGPDSKGSAFFKVLRVSAETVEDLSPSRSASQWALARLFSVRADDLKHAAEPTEEFAQRVREGFARATSTLKLCEREGLDQWRARGNRADVFIGGWLANEQIDLDIPADFLSECGRLGLSLTLSTND
jgi:hypothetical protein